MSWLLLLSWLLPAPVREGRVDRIEGAYAVVLWTTDDVRDVPLCLFDGPVAEGDAVRLSVRLAPDGPWHSDGDRLQSAADADLLLPLPPGARPGRRYRVRLAAVAGPERSPMTDPAALAGSDADTREPRRSP